MQPVNRMQWKIAERIRTQLVDLHVQHYRAFEQQLAYLTTTQGQLLSSRRKLGKATARRYLDAAEKLRRRTTNLISDLQLQVETARRSVSEPIARPPRLSEIVRELDQVTDEFGDWRYEVNDDAVCVVTDPIELEGLYLGPFEIRFIISAIGDYRSRPPLTAVALDPHPATGADHVTHPHVSDDRVCLGEAVSSVAAAIESGRIGDLFLIVRSVLTHYNPDSPYVSIDDWFGEQCSDCGASICEDERYVCELCDQNYCDDCMGMCRSCDMPTCLGCLRQCSSCDEWICRDCMKTCTACNEACCKACLCDDLCPDCHERNETDDETTQAPEEDQTPTSVTPNRPEAA